MPPQLVNTERTLENAGRDRDLARDLVEVFLSTSDDLAHQLREAIGSQDWDGAARAAHSLKSPLGFFGADATAEVAQTVETRARAEQPAGIEAAVDGLLQDVRKIQSELLTVTF